jgi:hypothetical protein
VPNVGVAAQSPPGERRCAKAEVKDQDEGGS